MSASSITRSSDVACARRSCCGRTPVPGRSFGTSPRARHGRCRRRVSRVSPRVSPRARRSSLADGASARMARRPSSPRESRSRRDVVVPSLSLPPLPPATNTPRTTTRSAGPPIPPRTTPTPPPTLTTTTTTTSGIPRACSPRRSRRRSSGCPPPTRRARVNLAPPAATRTRPLHRNPPRVRPAALSAARRTRR